MTNFYVSPAGSDSKDGKSTSTAFKTIAKAFNVVKPGDTILLMDGVFLVSSPQIAKVSGTATAPITVKGLGTGAIVDGKNTELKVIIVQANYYRLSGFEVRNCGVGVQIEGSNCVVDKLKVHDMHRAGMTSVGIRVFADSGNCDNNIISNNEIWDIGGEGIYIGHAPTSASDIRNCARNEVFGNNIHDFGSDGIECKPYSEFNNVHDNRIDHGDTGLRIDRTTIQANNTITNCKQSVVINKRAYG